jgi:hypothetical protein
MNGFDIGRNRETVLFGIGFAFAAIGLSIFFD